MSETTGIETVEPSVVSDADRTQQWMRTFIHEM